MGQSVPLQRAEDSVKTSEGFVVGGIYQDHRGLFMVLETGINSEYPRYLMPAVLLADGGIVRLDFMIGGPYHHSIKRIA